MSLKFWAINSPLPPERLKLRKSTLSFILNMPILTTDFMSFSMNNSSNFAWKAGAFLGSSGVLLGAFGAHGLSKYVNGDIKKLTNWRTASNYQLIHAAALLAIGAATPVLGPSAPLAAKVIATGTTAFSGSIYLLTISSPTFKILGPITPIGGLALAAGWLALLF